MARSKCCGKDLVNTSNGYHTRNRYIHVDSLLWGNGLVCVYICTICILHICVYLCLFVHISAHKPLSHLWLKHVLWTDEKKYQTPIFYFSNVLDFSQMQMNQPVPQIKDWLESVLFTFWADLGISSSAQQCSKLDWDCFSQFKLNKFAKLIIVPRKRMQCQGVHWWKKSQSCEHFP